MKIHEYQAKQLFRDYHIPVQDGYVAFSVEEAVAAAKKLGSEQIVVKAQIQAGGRGKAGGVKIANDLPAVRSIAEELLFSNLVTAQTSPTGTCVRKLLIAKACEIEKEYYLSLAIDPKESRIILIASREGGMNIETLAKTKPASIFKLLIHPSIGLRAYQIRQLAEQLSLPVAMTGEFTKLVQSLYRLFTALDCSIVEINPLVQTKTGHFMALDAKIIFDDSALYRHPDVNALRDLDEEDPKEVEASRYNLSYIALSGNIGCLVNGAGLAMATMDMIQLYGQQPANFLDIGGSASTEKVIHAFKTILKDQSVHGILVNIFGGIMHCDVIAEGIVAATKSVALKVPLVVRLNGTNKEKGNQILADSGLEIIIAQSMIEAVEKMTNLIAK